MGESGRFARIRHVLASFRAAYDVCAQIAATCPVARHRTRRTCEGAVRGMPTHESRLGRTRFAHGGCDALRLRLRLRQFDLPCPARDVSPAAAPETDRDAQARPPRSRPAPAANTRKPRISKFTTTPRDKPPNSRSPQEARQPLRGLARRQRTIPFRPCLLFSRSQLLSNDGVKTPITPQRTAKFAIPGTR